MKVLFTTKEVAKILSTSRPMLDLLAKPNADKNHHLYLQFSGGNGEQRLYARSVIKAKLIELGVSEQDAEQTLSAFDIQSHTKRVRGK